MEVAQMRPDPVIDEIRRVRHQISAEHDHDPRKLVEHYIEYQKRFGDRLVWRTAEPSQVTADKA